MKARINTRYVPLIATIIVFALLYSVGIMNFRHFGTLKVFVNLLNDNSFLGIAAIGATFVILSGGIDLSVGSVIAFTSIFIASTVTNGMPPAIAILLSLLIGIALGAAMGAIIHYFELPPFLVTLAGLFFMRGMGFVICPQSIGIKDPFFETTVVEKWVIPLTNKVNLPFTAICWIILFILALYVLHFTKFGRNVYAVGGNEQSSLMMGLPVARTKIMIYTVGGLMSAAAGVVYTFYTQSGNPASCVGFELDTIASVVIGGTLLCGGSGFLAGTFFGVLILGLIQTLISFQGTLNSWWTKIAIGILILIFLLLQNIISSKSRKK